MKPRLTIGIPTYNRPDMLPTAIRSALAQTVPVKVLVADDGDDHQRTREILASLQAEAAAGGHVLQCYHSGAADLWPNWDSVARRCDTEFFLWLQDDDVILPYVAERVARAFDRFPEADTWMAQNKLGLDSEHVWWNNGNGPWCPLNVKGGIDEWEGEILAPTCYFLSWSLSPAVAFRRGPRFTAALDSMPMDCDIFAERLILVAMGGRFVADPCTAGVWVQHPGNTSRKQHDDQPRQTTILIDHLDRAMDALGDRWQEILALWCRLQHPHWIAGWIGELAHAESEGGASRYGAAIRRVMADSLRGRVRLVPRYRWWYRPIAWLRGQADGRRAAACGRGECP